MEDDWSNVLLERNVTVMAARMDRRENGLAITFDAWRDDSTVSQRVAFGERYFRTRGVAHVHVFAHWNHWFLVPDMRVVVDLINERAEGVWDRLLYGSSMGGFAALNYADKLAAGSVVAFAPQSSICPSLVPFEDRFISEAAELEAYWLSHREPAWGHAFELDRSPAFCLPARTYVGYDPGNRKDVAHVERISRRGAIVPIHCHGSSHFPALALRNAGLLGKLMDDIRAGDPTVASRAYRLSHPYKSAASAHDKI